jgi:hypothetical protein
VANRKELESDKQQELHTDQPLVVREWRHRPTRPRASGAAAAASSHAFSLYKSRCLIQLIIFNVRGSLIGNIVSSIRLFLSSSNILVHALLYSLHSQFQHFKQLGLLMLTHAHSKTHLSSSEHKAAKRSPTRTGKETLQTAAGKL